MITEAQEQSISLCMMSLTVDLRPHPIEVDISAYFCFFRAVSNIIDMKRSLTAVINKQRIGK